MKILVPETLYVPSADSALSTQHAQVRAIMRLSKAHGGVHAGRKQSNTYGF
jgi:hypothetical protein